MIETVILDKVVYDTARQHGVHRGTTDDADADTIAVLRNWLHNPNMLLTYLPLIVIRYRTALRQSLMPDLPPATDRALAATPGPPSDVHGLVESGMVESGMVKPGMAKTVTASPATASPGTANPAAHPRLPASMPATDPNLKDFEASTFPLKPVDPEPTGTRPQRGLQVNPFRLLGRRTPPDPET